MAKQPPRFLLTAKWPAHFDLRAVRDDLFAGFTSATVVLPQAVAFAAIAGLPVEFGIYTAIIPPVLAALFGSSQVMVSGPTLVISALVFATISPLAASGTPEFIAQVLALTFLVGVLQLTFGALRLGGLMNFISHSVMIGFTAAAAVLIMLSQIKDALGLAGPRGTGIGGIIINLGVGMPTSNPYAIIIAGLTLVTAALVRVMAPKLPAFIIALLAATIIGIVIDAESHEVRMVGALPSIFPSFSPPSPSFVSIQALVEPAFAVALLGTLEAVSIGRAFAVKTKQRFNTNREIVGQGLSNLVGSLFQCYAGSGSFTRSGVNYEAGGRTRLSAVSSSFFLVLVLVAVAPGFALIPIPGIAGLILFVAFRLIDHRAIKHILRTSGTETAILGVTFLAGLLINLEFAVYSGVITSLFIFLWGSARPALVIGAPDPNSTRRTFRNVELLGLPECCQAIFVRLEGPLYFGSVDYLDRELERLSQERSDQKFLVLLLRGVGDIDLPGAELLIEEIKRRRAAGGDLFIVARYPPLIEKLTRFHVLELLGSSNIFLSRSEAIPHIVSRLRLDICRQCTTRIFFECPPPEPAQHTHPQLDAAQPTSPGAKEVH